ncbi:MAG: cell division protein ZapA [Candidatus Competibacterales bacterium]
MIDQSVVPVTVEIMDNEYRVSCPAEERDALLTAASYLSDKMIDIRQGSKTIGVERIAVMAALNICYELLQERREHQAQLEHTQNRLQALVDRMDTALQWEVDR